MLHFVFICLKVSVWSIKFNTGGFTFQSDMMKSLSRTKPTVNDEDMKKLQKFTDDFGQEG